MTPGNDKMMILETQVGPLVTNCYVLANVKTKEAIIIDPGAEVQYIISFLEQVELNCIGIFLTHGHSDHIGAVEGLKVQYPTAPIYVGRLEKDFIENPEENLSIPIFSKSQTVKADVFLEDGQLLDLLGTQIEVIETKGHTIGSVCYYVEELGVLFSGDTVFYHSVGRTDMPTGNGGEILHSLNEIVLKLPEETTIYPGHGENTTVKEEILNNPFSDGVETL